MSNYTHNSEIDLVYLWVDGNDIDWLNKKNAFLNKEKGLNIDAVSKARTADNHELLHSLRSAETCAPWIRNIIIVTDEQKPHWLNTDNPKVKIIDIRDILPPQAIPCYNSVVIEYFLYRIPGLSERFLYANDDMFFHKPITPDFFFDEKSGFPIVRLQRSLFGKLINNFKARFNIHRNLYRITIDNAAKLIDRDYGKYYSGTPHHNIDAYLKSDLRNITEVAFKEEISQIVTNHFRHESDIQRILMLYYALATKRGVLKYMNRYESCRIRVYKPDFMWFIKKYNPALFCLNDTPRATDEDRARIKPFLETLFPNKSSFEK